MMATLIMRLSSARMSTAIDCAHQKQRGVALVVALILLVVITLIGLGAIRATTVQQRLSGNFYDRQLAFQAAQGGLQAGVQYLTTHSNNIFNCAVGQTPSSGMGNPAACTMNPFTDPNVPASDIQTVAVATTGTGAAAAGSPQFVIQFMGRYVSASGATGFGQSANANQYGAQGLETTSNYYRITARSANPSTIGGRAVVTLQAYFKQ